MRFSIIIPAYNVDKYIGSAIDSVINQTYDNYELIVVDDCSTDDTVNEIKKYDDKIVFIQHSVNKGVSSARNIGIEVSNGEYILFLDADDVLESNNVLEKLDRLIGADNPDIIYLGFEFKNSKDIICPLYDQRKSLEYSILEDRFPNIWSKCWNREFLNKNNIRFVESLKYYEDVPFSIHGICLSREFKVADFITHLYTDDRKEGATDDFVVFKNIRTVSDIYLYISELIQLTENVSDEAKKYLFQLVRRATLNSIEWVNKLEKK